jgi:uroporphyrinogen III methyltransferase/synthase
VTVYLVGAGPGDPGLLTLRGAELLARADVVVYDRLVDPALLLLAAADAEMIDVGKVPGDAGVPGAGRTRQQDINALLVARGHAGATVVRLKGGDPYLFGRGGEEVEALRHAGVEVEVIPGVPSAFAVPAAAGVPATHRGLSTSVTVVTGHVGDPTAPGAVDWESLGRAGGTLVVLMGMATRAEISRRLLDAGRPADTPVAVVEWGTTPAQRVERTTLEHLADVGLGSPSVIVVGPVAGLDLTGGRGARRAGGAGEATLSGVSVVVTRPKGPADALSGALRAAGARVVAFPVVEIADPADGGAALAAAARRIGDYRWIAFTSANAVDRLMALVRDVRALGGVRLAAVGDGTAAALSARHLVADLVPGRADAGSLAESFPPADVPGAGVLFPCAEGARPALPAGLRAKGWAVDEVVAYRTVPISISAAQLAAVAPALAGAAAVVFASPSAVRAYVALAVPVPRVVVCIGPVTAGAAAAEGLDVTVVAREPSVAAVLDALADALADACGDVGSDACGDVVADVGTPGSP